MVTISGELPKPYRLTTPLPRNQEEKKRVSLSESFLSAPS